MLCQEAIMEWKVIYDKQTNKNIRFEEAKEKAERMSSLLKTIYITDIGDKRKLNQIKGGVKIN